MDNDQKKSKIEEHVRAIMETLELDLTDDSLEGTPRRVAKMYVDEWFYGLQEDKFPKIMAVDNKMKYNQVLVEKNIKVNSVCEHHLVPIVGVAQVAYIPDKKVIGLSKLNRIVDYYSRKPQIQERLTEEIFNKLVEILGTENVAVIVDAKHFCVITRGIKDVNSSTVTSKLGGQFLEKEVRQELMDLINQKVNY